MPPHNRPQSASGLPCDRSRRLCPLQTDRLKTTLASPYARVARRVRIGYYPIRTRHPLTSPYRTVPLINAAIPWGRDVARYLLDPNSSSIDTLCHRLHKRDRRRRRLSGCW